MVLPLVPSEDLALPPFPDPTPNLQIENKSRTNPRYLFVEPRFGVPLSSEFLQKRSGCFENVRLVFHRISCRVTRGTGNYSVRSGRKAIHYLRFPETLAYFSLPKHGKKDPFPPQRKQKSACCTPSVVSILQFANFLKTKLARTFDRDANEHALKDGSREGSVSKVAPK